MSTMSRPLDSPLNRAAVSSSFETPLAYHSSPSTSNKLPSSFFPPFPPLPPLPPFLGQREQSYWSYWSYWSCQSNTNNTYKQEMLVCVQLSIIRSLYNWIDASSQQRVVPTCPHEFPYPISPPSSRGAESFARKNKKKIKRYISMSDCVNRKASPSYLCFGPTRVMDARRLPGTAAGGGHHVGRRGGRRGGRRSLVPSASPVSLVFVLEQHTQRVPCLRANVAPWRHRKVSVYETIAPTRTPLSYPIWWPLEHCIRTVPTWNE
jgi:hypothetical protein